MSDAKIIDLGDFIPQKISIKFTVNGRRYEFDFMEAKVDDVLHILAEKQEDKEENTVETVRRTVTTFLKKIAPAGSDLAQLEKDLESVPYRSGRQALDMVSLYEAIQNNYRVPKGRGA